VEAQRVGSLFVENLSMVGMEMGENLDDLSLVGTEMENNFL